MIESVQLNPPKSPFLPFDGAENPYCPKPFNERMKRIVEEIKIGDHRGEGEKCLSLSRKTLSVLRTGFKYAWYFLESGLFLQISKGPLGKIIRGFNKSICFTGLALNSLDALLEISGLVSLIQFKKTTHPSHLKTLKNIYTLPPSEENRKKITFFLKKFEVDLAGAEIKELASNPALSTEIFFNRFAKATDKIENHILRTTLENIHRNYFQVSPEIANGIDGYIAKHFSHMPIQQQRERRARIVDSNIEHAKEYLAMRVKPWLANRIQADLAPLLEELQSEDPIVRTEAKNKAETLFKKIDIQTKKTLIVHVIGLIGIALSTAGLITSMVVCPLALPLSLLLLGTIVGLGHYCLRHGWLKAEDWQFSPIECIPLWIRNLPEIAQNIWERVFPKETPLPSVEQRILQLSPQREQQLA